MPSDWVIWCKCSEPPPKFQNNVVAECHDQLEWKVLQRTTARHKHIELVNASVNGRR